VLEAPPFPIGLVPSITDGCAYVIYSTKIEYICRDMTRTFFFCYASLIS
jgi:hypothetical protein